MAAYTTIDNPELYFQVKLWTGNGSNPRTITLDGDENMQPDMVWYKCRSHAVPNILLDSVRTAGMIKNYNQTTLQQKVVLQQTQMVIFLHLLLMVLL